LKWFGAVTAGLGAPQKAFALADESKIPDTLDIDNFLRYGQVSNPMGVSGQAGKSRPETGVILRCVPYLVSLSYITFWQSTHRRALVIFLAT
jgi:hypothetical protein